MSHTITKPTGANSNPNNFLICQCCDKTSNKKETYPKKTSESSRCESFNKKHNRAMNVRHHRYNK